MDRGKHQPLRNKGAKVQDAAFSQKTAKHAPKHVLNVFFSNFRNQ
jgi:hypothetical protein